MRGLSPAAASGDHSSSRYAGLSPSRTLLLRNTGSRRAGSAIVAHGPSCSAACGIFPDQGPNPCPPHRQADSQPLRHQGSPGRQILNHCTTREAHFACLLYLIPVQAISHLLCHTPPTSTVLLVALRHGPLSLLLLYQVIFGGPVQP